MIHSEALAEEFFKLKTKVAGNMLQKFANYQLKTVVVISDSESIKGKSVELVLESNKGNQFGAFSSREAAEEWLLKGLK